MTKPPTTDRELGWRCCGLVFFTLLLVGWLLTVLTFTTSGRIWSAG